MKTYGKLRPLLRGKYDKYTKASTSKHQGSEPSNLLESMGLSNNATVNYKPSNEARSVQATVSKTSNVASHPFQGGFDDQPLNVLNVNMNQQN